MNGQRAAVSPPAAFRLHVGQEAAKWTGAGTGPVQAGFDSRAASIFFVLLLWLLLLTPLAYADGPPAPVEAGWTKTIEAGAAGIITKGGSDSYFRTRLTIAGPVITKDLRVFFRGDLARTQDGGDLADPSTFRSIEAGAGARYRIGPNLSAGAIGGVTFSIEDKATAPSDPRLYTALGILCRDNLGRPGGYACIGAGHRGPVGGPAAALAVSIPVVGSISSTVDIDVPFKTINDRNTWVIKLGGAWAIGF